MHIVLVISSFKKLNVYISIQIRGYSTINLSFEKKNTVIWMPLASQSPAVLKTESKNNTGF